MLLLEPAVEAAGVGSSPGALFCPPAIESSLPALAGPAGLCQLLRLPVFSPGHRQRSPPAHPGHLLADPVGPCQPHQQGDAHPPSGVSAARPSSTFCGWGGCSLPGLIPGNCPGMGNVAVCSGEVSRKESSGKRWGVSSCFPLGQRVTSPLGIQLT